MAIYHFSVKTISRSAGRSAVACAAYRSGEKLIDNKYNKNQDYTRKTGVEYKKIYAPKETNKELLDRQTLWNKVEEVEKRKDSTLAREFEIAFPCELLSGERKRLLDDLCNEIVKKHNVIVDAVIHAPHTKGGSDERNYHAHIMFTSRQIDKATGEFATKKDRDFNKEKSSETVNTWRKEFADLTNMYLISKGVQIDHRSYKDQGLNLEATQHEGNKVTALRREGKHTEISLKNDAIKERNAETIANEQIIKGLDQEILLTQQKIDFLKKQQVQEIVQEPNLRSRIRPSNKIEPEKPKNIPIDNKETAQKIIANFKELLEKTQKDIFQKEINQEVTFAKEWFAKIEEMRSKTPMFLGKKAHLAKIDNEVAQYEKMRLAHLAKKSTGVTPEHKKTANDYVRNHHKDEVTRFNEAVRFYKKLELQKYREQIEPRIDAVAVKDKIYSGKVIQSNDQGIIQETKHGLIFHDFVIKEIQEGKTYNLEQKSDTGMVNIQEDYHVQTAKSAEKDKINNHQMDR